jgi:hypothetical protein
MKYGLFLHFSRNHARGTPDKGGNTGIFAPLQMTGIRKILPENVARPAIQSAVCTCRISMDL